MQGGGAVEEAAEPGPQSVSQTVDSGPDKSSVAKDEVDGEQHWLLCVVVCCGDGLFVGADRTCGDIFCMLHTYDGISRSRTAVTGMVYNNASPQWPSNGNGNAFVLPVKSSSRDTNLVITVWDGSESMEEANPVGKVEINLKDYMAYPKVDGDGLPDRLPARREFPVDLVPRLSELHQGEVKLTLMLERADKSFCGAGAKDIALNDLLNRLCSARKRDRMHRIKHWSQDYPSLSPSKGQGHTASDYSLVALLTKDVSPNNVEDCTAQAEQEADDNVAANGRPATTWGEKEEQPLDGMLERLSEGSGAKLSTVPVRAQAELLARLRPLQFDDGMVILAKGTKPTSIFFVRSGAVTVTVNGEEVSRIDAGQCLGEVGLLLGERRIADVRACGRTELFELNEQDLWMALDMFPGLYKELHSVAEMRYEHVRSREDWGADKANVWTTEGPLREFQMFLQNVSTQIPWTSFQVKSPEGASESKQEAVCGSPIVSPMANVPVSSLNSISETDVHHENGPMGVPLVGQDSTVYADQLSKRLEHFEKSGAFGPGQQRSAVNAQQQQSNSEAVPNGAIMIPSRNNHRHLLSGMSNSPITSAFMMPSPSGVSGSYARPLRGEISYPVGSLEQARQQHGMGHIMSALSPKVQTGWDEPTSTDESDNSVSEEDGSATGEDTPSERAPPATQVSMSLPISYERLQRRGGDHKHGVLSSSVGKDTRNNASDTDSKGSRKSHRSTLFKIRFRKVHDCYTPEELGCSSRRKHVITVSGISLQSYKDSDINAYFFVEGTRDARLARSEVIKGDKNDLHWPRPITVEVEESLLVEGHRLRFTFFQSRKLWSDRFVGYAMVNLHDALLRPSVPIQHTYELVKDRVKTSHSDGDENAMMRAAGGDSNKAGVSPKTIPRTNSLGQMLGRFAGMTGHGHGHGHGNEADDDLPKTRVKGTVTVIVSALQPARLPFCLNVPPISNTSNINTITDHLGKVVCKLEYMGRSRCAWCTNVDPSEGFHFGFFEASEGASTEPCCNACSIKGWSECVVLWDADMQVRLGTVCTDVTPRKHARARLCDHDTAHFASVRAAATSRPEISAGVRFKIVVTFHELVVRTTGSMIQGKSCSSSYQVLERVSESSRLGQSAARSKQHKEGSDMSVIAEITRGSNTESTTLMVQPGKDAGRALLLAVGINEACRLRPKAVHDGTIPRDKFDRDYEESPMERSSAHIAPDMMLLESSPKDIPRI